MFAGKYEYSKLNPDNAGKFIIQAISLSDEEKVMKQKMKSLN
jgi:hypothetical protein